MSSLTAIRVRQQDALSKNTTARTHLAAELRRTGFSTEQCDALFEVYEKLWDPRFGAAGDRWKENDQVRRVFDAAMRRGVDEAAFTRYVGSMKDVRSAEADARKAEEAIYRSGGNDGLLAAETDAKYVLGLRDDIVQAARKMNPNVDLEVAYSATELPDAMGPHRYDPVRRLAAVALDPSELTNGLAGPQREAYRTLWQSIEGLLSEKERKVLLDEIAPSDDTWYEVSEDKGETWRAATRAEIDARGREIDKDLLADGQTASAFTAYEAFQVRTASRTMSESDRMEALARAFAVWAAPERKRGPRGWEGRLKTAFAPVSDFFERVGNYARGRGFQTVEDIFERAIKGDVAAREGQHGIRTDALKMPLPGQNRDGYDRTVAAVRRMSDVELVTALRKQEAELERVGGERRGLMRGLRRNAVTRAVSGKVAESMQTEDREFKQMARAAAAMRREMNKRREQTVERAVSTFEGGGPDGGRSIPGAEVPPPLVEQRGQAIKAAGDNVVPFAAPAASRDIQWHVAKSGDGYAISLRPEEGGPSRVYARTRTPEAAADFLEAMDDTSAGVVSIQAASLARDANRAGLAGNADIKAIRASGLLDERLDQLIETRDLFCHVYPLKSGDVLYMGQGGEWKAATFERFAAEAAGNRALEAGLDVLGDARHEAAEAPTQDIQGPSRPPAGPAAVSAAANQDRGMSEPAPPDAQWLIVPPSREADASRAGARLDAASGRYYVDPRDNAAMDRTAEWHVKRPDADRDARADAEQTLQRTGGRDAVQEAATTTTAGVTQAAAAAFSAGAAGRQRGDALRLDPALSSGGKRDAVRDLQDSAVIAAARATQDALEGLKQQNAASENGLSLRDKQAMLELSTGLHTLRAEAASRGIKLESTAQGKDVQRRVQKAKSRSAGIGG